MLRTLTFITLRQWRAHKLRTALTILSIALGVALLFAVLTANVTLVNSLKLTVEKLAGKATLQVTASESGFPEEILETVRDTPGVQIAEPVIEVIAHTAFKDEANLMIVGVDTTGDQKLREYEFDESQTDIGDPLVYVAQPNSILVSRKFAEAHGLKQEDKLPLYTSQGRKEFTIRGIFKPTGIGEVFDGQIAVMDVYSAQFVFDRGHNFDRIDIMTDPNVGVEAVEQRLHERLPTGIEVDRPATRGQSIENTFTAMRQGMIITSFIALLVGIFIIFNSFTISVNQRWKEIGILRSLGVERSNVAKMFLGESILMGLIGSSIGIASGFYLANGATKFTAIIAAQIYGYASTPEPPIFRFDYAVTSFALGVATSLIAAWLPARTASRLNPVLALHNIEIRQREAVIGWTRMTAGAIMVAAGLLLVRFATARVGLLFQFSYALLMMLGLVVMLPKLAEWIARALRPIMDWAFGSEGVLAVDTMIESPRRTSATVGALMICLMFVFSTGAYVQSYKRVALRWMDRMINADFFVKTSAEQVRSRTYHLTEDFSRRIAAIPGVKRVENVRFTFVPYKDDKVALTSIEMDGWFARVHDVIEEGDEKRARELMPKGEGVLISRNFVTRWGVRLGDNLRIETPKGTLVQPILGIMEDYSSEKGSFFIDRSLYKEYWQDSAVDFIDVNMKPGVDRATLKREIERITAGEQRAFVYTNQEYKQWVMDLLDQFFLINYIQMFVAIFVAAIGIFNTLVISVSERQREIGILRAVGGLRGQIRKMVLLEAIAIAVTGLMTGVLAGTFNTYFLVRVAAVTLGGFTIPFHFPAALILLTLPIVIAVALTAAWWPARSAVNLKVIEAIGYE